MIKAHCNKCQRETNQEIICTETTSWEDEIDEGVILYGKDVYEMLKCCGCDSIILRHQEYFCDEPSSTFHHYPPAISRPEPKWLHELNNIGDEGRIIYELLKEIYSSLHNNSRRLATMGIRALIEHVMINKTGDKGSFSQNLEAFAAYGLISLSQEDILNTVLEAGHATMHRAYSPSPEDLHTCMDIAESIIASVYVHPKRAKLLKTKIPKR